MEHKNPIMKLDVDRQKETHMKFTLNDLIPAPHSTKLDRRLFIGGSDARIIMSPDETALNRLWKEKRGEAEPEDFSDNLVVQLGVATEALNRAWYERNTGRAITDVQRWVRHPVHRYLAATLDGFVNDLDAVFEAKFMLPWSFSEEVGGGKAHGPAPAQHVGHQRPLRRALDHHRRRQMDRNGHPCRRSIPAFPHHRRARRDNALHRLLAHRHSPLRRSNHDGSESRKSFQIS